MARQVGAVVTVNWSAGSIRCSAPGKVTSQSDPIPVQPAVPQVQGGLVKKAIISTPGSGAEVAKRYKLPVDDFCRWNAFGKTTPLPAGYEVYLTPPPAGTVVVANMGNLANGTAVHSDLSRDIVQIPWPDSWGS